MQIPKDQIISMIESKMGSGQAQQAAQQLPDQVDHEQHSDLLQKFGVNPQDLMQRFGGGKGIGGAGGDQGAGGDPSLGNDQTQQ